MFIKNHISCINHDKFNKKLLFVQFVKGNSLYKKSVLEYSSDSTPVVELKIESKFYKFFFFLFPLINYFIYAVYQNKIAPSFKADIIHSNVVFPAGIWGYYLAKKLKLPYIISEHWSGTNKFITKNLFGFLGKKVYENAFTITAVSSFLKNEIIKSVPNLDKNKIEIIPNLVQSDFSEIVLVPKEKNVITFVAIARWVKPKRLDLLIESLKIIAAKFHDKKIVFNLIGEGVLIDDYKTQNFEDNLKVNFLGFLNKEQIKKWSSESNYFLHASDVETFSIVTAESLMAGLPVLVSNRGALPDLVNDVKFGYLAENEIENWVLGIEKLINTTFENDYIKKRNENRFTDTVISSKFEEIYNSIR